MSRSTPLDERGIPLFDAGFHHVLSRMPGVAYVGSEGLTGKVAYMSPRIEELTGYPPERFVGSRDFWFTLLHADDLERVKAADRVAETTFSPYVEEYRMVTADERVVWVRDEATYVQAAEGRPAYWIGLIVDITREKEAESHAAEAEQRYRTLIERLPIVTYIDVPDESLANLFVSPQINDLLGRPSGATGDEWAERVHPEDRERARRETVDGVRSGKPFTLEYRMVRDDGRVIWVSDSAITVRNDRGEPEYVLGSFYDITQRKEAELRLQELERRYRSLVEQLPAVTYMDTADEEMTSIYVSPQVETILGLSADAFVTDGAWSAHLHPDDREQAVQSLRDAIRAGDPFTLEYRMIRPDGSIVWIRDRGSVVMNEAGDPEYVQGLYEDISEQKRLESDLRSEAVKFKSLAERIPAVVYIEGEGGSDDAPFYMSPQYEKLFGYTPDERQANPTLWRELLHPQDRERAIEAAKRSYEEGGFSEDYRMVARDGRIVWVHDETVLIRDDEGNPLFWQGVLYDISEQKRAEQELAQALEMERRAVDRLREADDMKNTFLTAVSHDLRTPLSAILGSAITLESADELGISEEDRQQLIRSLAKKAKRLTAMVNDLLDMDRLTRGLVQPRRELIDLGALLGRTAAESDVLDERTVHVYAEPIDAWIDESMVKRIVENLLVNAVKHTPPTATIWVGARRVVNGVVLRVEDDGPGVAADERDRLFEPFERGERSAPSPGLGVGLSLVARFADAHGGRAWVEDREGGGASFRVLFPDPTRRLPAS
ncbi:MAG: PAS domain-containing protein [Actinobacteria bacterium]|nr:PAS domain-containing protein [Actinomycetota bacterium]